MHKRSELERKRHPRGYQVTPEEYARAKVVDEGTSIFA